MRRISLLTPLLVLFSNVCWHAPQAEAAQLRLQGLVRGASVRLSDLFTGLRPGQDCDIGSAPDPGKQIIIPGAQLAAIASEFGVDLPIGAGYGVVVLRRLARHLTEQELIDVLHPALVTAGMIDPGVIRLASVNLPLMSADLTSAPVVQAVDLDRNSGRFTAVLLFSQPDSEPVTFNVTGRAQQMTDALTLVHALPAGTVLTDNDLQLIRTPISDLVGKTAVKREDAIGRALKHRLDNNVAITDDILIHPLLMERGKAIVLRLESPGLSLTAAGTALEGGARGDRIHVMNSSTRAVLVGEVAGGSEVRVLVGGGGSSGYQVGQPAHLPETSAKTSWKEPPL